MKHSVAGRRSRGITARAVGLATVLFGGLVLAGCGLGPGEDTGEASLLVTRDYGSKIIVDEPELSVNDSSTAMRLLDENIGVKTEYGGEFVQEVDGLAGGSEGGRSFDWFFSVNGIVAERGSAQFPIGGGDKVWWDYRDWTDVMEVGAVVGEFPAPFSTGYDGRNWGVEVDCLGDDSACGVVERQLEKAGVELNDTGENMRLIVGTGDDLDGTAEARRLKRGPSASGVFARFCETTPEAAAGREPVNDGPLIPAICGLDQETEIGSYYTDEVGLIAAMRRSEDPPVWLITGLTDEGVQKAAAALEPKYLERRYAAVVSGNQVSSLPVP